MVLYVVLAFIVWEVMPWCRVHSVLHVNQCASTTFGIHYNIVVYIAVYVSQHKGTINLKYVSGMIHS